MKLDAIGDVALFTSVLPHLRAHYSTDTITLGVNPAVSSLVQGCPHVDHIVLIDQMKFAVDPRYSREITAAIRSKYDIVINAKYTRTSQAENIIARTRAPVKIGFECRDRDELFEMRNASQILYTTLVPSKSAWKFEIERYADLLSTLGMEVRGKQLIPDLWLSDKELHWAEKFIRENTPADRPLCIVCPGAGFGSKIWALENYVPVLRTIVERHKYLPIILGSHKDSVAAEEIIRLSDCGALDFTGKLNLREFAVLTSKAGLYVGIDTAGFHLAWIHGIPTVGIFGGGHDTRFIPAKPHVRTVRVPMDCYRCYWHCIYDEIKCITSITPAMVSDAVEELLSSTPRTGVH